MGLGAGRIPPPAAAILRARPRTPTAAGFSNFSAYASPVLLGPAGPPLTPAASIRRNYVLNLLLTLLNIAYPFATLAYLARIIGPGYLGKYYIASSLVSYLLFAATLGIPLYATREIASRRGDAEATRKLVSELGLINAASSLVAGLVFLAVVAAVPDFRRDWPLYLILGLMVPMNAFCMDFLFMGMENPASIAKRALAAKSASLILLFLLVREADDYLWYAAITSGSALLHNASGVPSALRLVRPTLKGINPLVHARPLSLFLLNLVIVNVYFSLDSVVLGLLTDEKTVGYYNAAMRLSRVAATVLAAVGVTVLPRMTRFLEGGQEAEYRALIGKSLSLLFLLSVPASLTLGLAAPGIIALVFGAGFSEAAPALQVAAPLVAVTGLTGFMGAQAMLPRRGDLALVIASAAGAVVSLSLIVLLAPKYGHVGAAWASLGAETAVLASQWIWVRVRHGGISPGGLQPWKYVVAGAAMAAVLVVFRAATDLSPPCLAAALAASGAAYFGILYAVREPLLREAGAVLAGRLRRSPGAGGPGGTTPC